MNKVSIIMPAYNRQKYIKWAIESVLTQTHQNWELIVVDDCSTDQTPQIVKGYTDLRIRYIRLEKNSGAQVARNEGKKMATGDFIAFLDSDDEYRPNFMTCCLMTLEHEPECGIVYCGYEVVDEQGRVLRSIRPKSQLRGDLKMYAVYHLVLMPTSTFLARRELFDNIEFDPRLPSWQDDDIFLKLAMKTRFAVIREPLCRFRQHNETRISGDLKKYADGHFLLIEAHRQEILSLAGPRVLADHYLEAAVDYWLAGDDGMCKKLLAFSNGAYHRFFPLLWFYVIIKLLKKMTFYAMRKFYYSFLNFYIGRDLA
uniref:Glycosyltransferase family 2 protein n=1 Tax=candidate division CPR3 bacterium TaxID=2268181 RepID=A0A7V3J9K7_UNCC3